MESKVESAKREAAIAAVTEFITGPDMVIGIGSGSTVVYAVEALIKLCESKNWTQVKCVPTSFQAEQLITAAEPTLALCTLTKYPQLDVTIDGADEVDSELNLIKGGGGCQLREKLVGYNSKNLVIIADYRKKSNKLGQQWHKGVPLEVLPLALVPVTRTLEEIFKSIDQDAKCVLRMAKNKAGPVVTDNGNVIVDCTFGELPCSSVAKLNADLKMIPGLVETGFFVNMAVKAFFGEADGSVSSRVNVKSNL